MNLASLLQLLEELYSLNISFEICHPLLYRIRPLRLGMKQYQHHSPFCQYYKSRDGSLSCYENKSRIIRKVRDGKCRESVCSYGICEYTLPILRNGLLLGVFFFGTFIREEKKVRLPPGIEMPARITPEIRKKLRQAASLIQDYVHLEISRSGMEELLNERTHSEQFYLENCRDFIEQHFQENIALADLAEQLGVNANYLGGLLHRLQKESFRAQLTRRRLLEAKEWLTTRYDCSISDVAFGCGFQDSNYFSMVFRRAFGITPTAYRRKQHGREVPNHSPSPQRETK